MKRQRFAIAAAGTTCLVLYNLLLAGPAKAEFNGAFKTPSGNIICDLSNSDVVCVIKSGLEPAPPKTSVCNGGDPVSNRVDLTAAGIAEPVLCAGDPGPLVDDADAKVLTYGSTMVKGGIGCVSFEFGLACVNSKGHGFFLSRASARYF
jgi:hypothetical protein